MTDTGGIGAPDGENTHVLLQNRTKIAFEVTVFGDAGEESYTLGYRERTRTSALRW